LEPHSGDGQHVSRVLVAMPPSPAQACGEARRTIPAPASTLTARALSDHGYRSRDAPVPHHWTSGITHRFQITTGLCMRCVALRLRSHLSSMLPIWAPLLVLSAYAAFSTHAISLRVAAFRIASAIWPITHTRSPLSVAIFFREVATIFQCAHVHTLELDRERLPHVQIASIGL
jgi:hypothetical protein